MNHKQQTRAERRRLRKKYEALVGEISAILFALTNIHCR